MSRTIKFAKAGGPEVLEFLETEVPAPGPTELRIKGDFVLVPAASRSSSVSGEQRPVRKDRRYCVKCTRSTRNTYQVERIQWLT